MSGLRYPGGKTRSVDLLARFIPSGQTSFVSPFIGGGSFEIHLSKRGHVSCYDIFKPLVTYWNWLLRDPSALADTVQTLMPVNKERFGELQKLLAEHVTSEELNVAARYFAVNRCSFSGTTLSGGYSQEAATKRFTQSSIDRLRETALTGITVACQSFEETLREPTSSFVFADPPYYTAKKRIIKYTL